MARFPVCRRLFMSLHPFCSPLRFSQRTTVAPRNFSRARLPPSGARSSAEQTHPICFSEIAVLYSGISRTPLWSAEHLTPARIEHARNLPRLRSNAFHEEPKVPGKERSGLSDYRRSGFDRGHMAPNGDMSTPVAQEELFSLANMIPQDPCNNEVLWEGIEFAVRDIALAGDERLRRHWPRLSRRASCKVSRAACSFRPMFTRRLRAFAQRRRSLFRAQ